MRFVNASTTMVLDMCLSKGEILVKTVEFSEGKGWRPTMMFTVDRALAPVRLEPSLHKGTRSRGDWEEGKGFWFYLVDRDRIEHFMSWH